MCIGRKYSEIFLDQSALYYVIFAFFLLSNTITINQTGLPLIKANLRMNQTYFWEFCRCKTCTYCSCSCSIYRCQKLFPHKTLTLRFSASPFSSWWSPPHCCRSTSIYLETSGPKATVRMTHSPCKITGNYWKVMSVFLFLLFVHYSAYYTAICKETSQNQYENIIK